MLALTDEQIELVKRGAGYLPETQRDRFLRSLAGRLDGSAFSTADLAQAIQFILSGFGVSAPSLGNKMKHRAAREMRRKQA